MAVTRDQLVAAAMHLFGERGYEATSVAEIQVACGLTAGSGALYKHFPSKRALLAEGVHRYVAELEKSRARLIGLLPEQPEAALRAIGEAVLAAMAGDRAVIRIGLRDLERFPDLLQILWEGLLDVLYREIAEWLTAQRDAHRIAVTDPVATAAVLVASLTYYRILESLIGHSPGDVEAGSYLNAWVASALATVTSTHGEMS